MGFRLDPLTLGNNKMPTYKVLVDSEDFKANGDQVSHTYKNVKMILGKKTFEFIDLITGECIASHPRRKTLHVVKLDPEPVPLIDSVS